MCVTVKLNGVEVKAIIDTRTSTNLVKASLVLFCGLQVARANIAISLTLHHRVVSDDIMVANLSMST